MTIETAVAPSTAESDDVVVASPRTRTKKKIVPYYKLFHFATRAQLIAIGEELLYSYC